MLVQHVRQPPDPPSRHTELAVPPALDELILECLRKNKTERPQSVEVLEARLAAIDSGAVWTLDQARQWWELHRPAGAPTLEGAADPPGHHLSLG